MQGFPVQMYGAPPSPTSTSAGPVLAAAPPSFCARLHDVAAVGIRLATVPPGRVYMPMTIAQPTCMARSMTTLGILTAAVALLQPSSAPDTLWTLPARAAIVAAVSLGCLYLYDFETLHDFRHRFARICRAPALERAAARSDVFVVPGGDHPRQPCLVRAPRAARRGAGKHVCALDFRSLCDTVKFVLSGRPPG